MRALDSALNNVEEQKVLADIRYHEEITFRMVLATILGLASIVAIFEWNEKPSHIHLLIFGIVSVFIVINQIVIMTYESDK